MEINLQNRGTISNMDCAPSCGSVSLSNDKKILKWNIGQKFVADPKKLEIKLPAIVYLESLSTPSDPFFVKQNAFAKANFTHKKMFFV